MTPAPAGPADELDGLRESFARLLPERLDKIASGWREIAQGAWNASAAREVRLSLHSLAGSAGTFGFDGVGRIARAAELKLDRLLDTGGVPAKHELEDISRMLVRLVKLGQTSARKRR